MADEPVEDNSSYKRNYFTPRNILIYVVIAIILYGAVYFLFLKNKSNSPYQAPTTTTEETTGNTTTSENSMTVTLGAQNESGQDGTATLTEANGQTTVTINVTGAPAGVEEPAHIHAGACPTPGEVVYPLSNVVDGVSETVLDADLATIKGQLPLVVNVHKSEAQSSVYVSCGDLQ